MKMKEDGVPCQAREGFVGVHIGAGQHSEVMSERRVTDMMCQNCGTVIVLYSGKDRPLP